VSFWALLDDKSNYIHVELLVAKSDVFSAYCKVEASWEAKSGNCVVAIRMDGAKELCRGRLEAHLHSRGIAMQVTAPYAHSQNGKIECFIRTLEDGFQTLLADSGLSMSFWGDAVLAYIRNRVPTSVLPMNMTPFKVMEHSKPDLSHLWVWGCQCFVAIPPELHDKGGPRCFEAIFVGYEENHLGWHVQDLNGKYHFSRDVIFNELVPGRLSPSCSSTMSSTSLPSSLSLPTPPSPAPHPPRTLVRTAKGQAFADAIQVRDERNAARRQNSIHPQQSLSAISDFVSFFATDELLLDELVDDLDSLEHDAFSSFCLLTSVDRFRFHRP